MSSKTKIKLSRRILSIVMVIMLTACIAFSAITQTLAATTTNPQVDALKKSILQVQMIYKPDNKEEVCSSGTCFLINPTTVISCAHIFYLTREDGEKYYGSSFEFNEKYVKGYEVLINGGVPVKATLRKINKKADYAILKLDETVKRPTVTLGSSDDVKVTQPIYTLGFPATVLATNDSKTYTEDQVAITSSTVSNKPTIDGVDYITHNANMTHGNSGGPLVDENGYVVGVNLVKDGEGYFSATAMEQIIALLDDLDIEYNKVGNVEPTTSVEETTIAQETTVAPAPVEPATISPEPEPQPMDTTKLIIIIAIAVLLLVVIAVVVIIIVSSKKKSADKAPTPQRGSTVMPMPGPGVPSPSAQRQPQQYNQSPVSPQYPQTTLGNDGAGETSVLNDGAGETTVLGNQSAGFTMIRTRNKEKININKPEFVIGKERRRVDYCISDNNSVSRTHAKIKVRAGRCYISDLGSTNCTYVNGTKLSPNQELILSKGDQIKVSDEAFEFLG